MSEPLTHPGPVSGRPCWSTSEVAGLLGVSRQTVHRWCTSGVAECEVEERPGLPPLFHVPVSAVEGLRVRVGSRRTGPVRSRPSGDNDVDVDALRQRLVVWEEIDRCRREQDRLRTELEVLRHREMELRSRLEVVPLEDVWDRSLGSD